MKMNVYSQFSLFVIVIFCKVAANTELVNTEPLLLGNCENTHTHMYIHTHIYIYTYMYIYIIYHIDYHLKLQLQLCVIKVIIFKSAHPGRFHHLYFTKEKMGFASIK